MIDPMKKDNDSITALLGETASRGLVGVGLGGRCKQVNERDAKRPMVSEG
jgi:hypothetical protein